ncbi:hypothetical protein ABH942_000067 [Flavobacterium sp. 28YEA47A]
MAGITIDMANTNQPKPFFRFFSLMNLLRYIPAKIPKIEIKEKINRMLESISILPISPVNPISELIAMINIEFPIAFSQATGKIEQNRNDLKASIGTGKTWNQSNNECSRIIKNNLKLSSKCIKTILSFFC